MKIPGFAHLLPLFILAFPSALLATQHKPVKVQKLATTSFLQATARAATPAFSAAPRKAIGPLPKPRLGSATPLAAATAQAISLTGTQFPVVGPDDDFQGFDGIDAYDSQSVADFTVEPPDQGLATNGSQVFEIVNLAARVFSTAGQPLAPPVSVYAFFNVSPGPNPDGSTNELVDPRVFYDWETGRWFATILEYVSTPQGPNEGGSSVLLAVSASSDALSSYTVFSIDTSDASYGACPCVGDQPLLGMNKDGVYLSTNEYSNYTGSFQTALVTAISKADLLSGTSTITAAGFDGMPVAKGGFSIQPSLPPPDADTDQNRGNEFFVSSLNFSGTGDNRLAVWALTNTQTLDSGVPNLNFIRHIITSERYAEPAPAVQKTGYYPFGISLGDKEETLETGDNRMQQVYYADGNLFCAFTTWLPPSLNSKLARSGAAWFVIQANATFSSLAPKILNQGYIGIKNGSVLYPSIAVSDSGDGIIGFTFTGRNYFPSTGYVRYDNGGVLPQVHEAGIGQRPDDGFSGYKQYGGSGVGHWGDYSAAVIAPTGERWIAGEYIPNSVARPRAPTMNWGTFIGRID